MNRKQIMMDYGHLSVDQLPDNVRDTVRQDAELLGQFEEAAWLQGLLELKRTELPASAAESRIQHRVETRINNIAPEEIEVLTNERRWYSFLVGNDAKDVSASPRSPFAAFATYATPVTLAAGMAIGLYAAHLMTVDPGPDASGDPSISANEPAIGGHIIQPTGPAEGPGFTNPGGLVPVSAPAGIQASNGFKRAVHRP